MNSWLVVAYEGVIADNRHRLHYQQASDWSAYEAAQSGDTPVMPIVNLAHRSELLCVISTARETHFQALVRWCDRHGVAPDCVMMRPVDNWMKETDLKLHLLESLFVNKELVLSSVSCVIDASDASVEAFRNYGLPTLQFSLAGSKVQK